VRQHRAATWGGKRHGDQRGTANERGYNYRWQVLSKQHLHRNPLCEECKRRGVIKAATEVDHIKPHRGDQQLFWDQSNWQSLCDGCHNEKSAAENQGSTMLPRWMPRPSKPLIVVCGPPGAGKTTYVDKHAEPGDAVIDLDRIAEAMGMPVEKRTTGEVDRLVRERNSQLAAFCEGRTRHKRCWLVATAGKPSHREFWRWLGAKVIELHPGVDVCCARVVADPIRTQSRKERVGAVHAWH
jgi:5-methylcytosine-specific restriction protein A